MSLVSSAFIFAVIGLRDPGNTGFEGTDPRRFKFIDGSTEREVFFATRLTIPWRAEDPNDEGGAQDCVR